MKHLFYSLLALGLAHPAAAQLSGTKTIDPAGTGPNNYSTFTAAITTLNAAGVGADGVLFEVKSGVVFPEIAPAITVSGSATGRIIFLKEGTGANPRLQGTGSGTTDAGLTLDGADFVTINGIDVTDAAANTTAAQQLEYGFWLKNGATNNLVLNSTVDLNRANPTKTSGVFLQDGNNNLNRFLSNTIQDCFYGYNFDAGSTNYDNGNEIGMLVGGAASRVLTIGAGAANLPTGIVYGIYLRSQTGAKVSGTEVAGLTGTSSVYGIYSTGTGNTVDIADNRVHALTATNSSGAAQGIYVNSGTLHSIYRNYTYDIAATGATGFASGMDITAGTTNNVYNNFVYDIRALASTAGTSVRALSFRGGTTNYCYHNTVVLTGAPTAATNKSGAFYISGSPSVDLRNNIFVNLITLPSGGGGVAAAFFKSTAVLTNLAAASNNNLLYAGTPSAEKPIFYGVATTPAVDQTLAQYKQRAAPADQSAVTENVPFVNPLTDPHLQAGAATQAESSGMSLASSPLPVPTDIDNAARTVATPDLGADEGTFQGVDVSGPSIAYQRLPNTASTGNRSLTVTISDPSGVATGALIPRLYYKKKTDANVFTEPNDATGNGWKWVAPASAASVSYIFLLDVAKLRSAPVVGDSIQYFVTAQDLAATPNVSATPGAGFAATSVASITSAPTKPSVYKVLGLLSGIKTVGTAATADYATLTAAVADLNSNELGGALTLVLQDAAYPTETYPLTLSANTGSSATNSVTIRPAPNRAVTLTANTSTPLFIVDASNVTIEGSTGGANSGSLALTNAGTTSSSGGIFVTGRDVTLRGLSIQGSSSATAYGVAFSGATNGTVRGCTITRTGTGIQAQASCVNFTAANNTIGSSTAADKIGTSGIVITATQGFVLNGNTIAGVTRATSPAVAGIVVGTTSADGVIASNQIRDIVHTGTGASDSYGAYGIRLSATGAAANIVLANNMISGILSSGDDGVAFTPQGVYLASGGGYKLGFNTIRLTGNVAEGSTPITGAVTIATGVSDVTLVNNILVNQQTATPSGGKTYALYSAGTASPFTLIDNNAYSVQGATAKLAYLNGTEHTTLAALRSATAQDAGSLLANPVFRLTTANDLRLVTDANCNLDGKARPVAGVAVDIDNDPRNASTPDIGADEFTATARVAPTAPSKFGVQNQTIPNLTATTAPGGTAVWYADAALTQRLFAGPSYATGRTTLGTYTYYVVDSLNACVSPATTVRLTIVGPDATVAALRDLSISCFPNPAHGEVTLRVEGPARTISAELLDALGRSVLRQQVRHQAPATQHPLNLQGLAQGIYLLRLTTEGQTTGRRIVVE
ncbi:T9SS type A sorting domain-containing protein [Hymenobacter cellulosilyticus]|uniref:T9SS type A sorting domain-containing protein n=1 Tax=Hymenobacter cellulosilyticus TaxID=2932248 RepID=A0A8T9QC07_9BACT|nr:T9SS type A sorting domain-containing protein [Hymenobacter cellulosilyticus]UOQ73079.1 T9SS type A sorting domain-containing protein [Hymenobacter cellulosilyticus]